MALCARGGVSTTVKWLIRARNGVWVSRQRVVLQWLRASGSKIAISSCWGNLLLLWYLLLSLCGLPPSEFDWEGQGKAARFSDGE